jgi:hypothetical protein
MSLPRDRGGRHSSVIRQLSSRSTAQLTVVLPHKRLEQAYEHLLLDPPLELSVRRERPKRVVLDCVDSQLAVLRQSTNPEVEALHIIPGSTGDSAEARRTLCAHVARAHGDMTQILLGVERVNFKHKLPYSRSEKLSAWLYDRLSARSPSLYIPVARPPDAL